MPRGSARVGLRYATFLDERRSCATLHGRPMPRPPNGEQDANGCYLRLCNSGDNRGIVRRQVPCTRFRRRGFFMRIRMGPERESVTR
jgi:hypothetical protein